MEAWAGVAAAGTCADEAAHRESWARASKKPLAAPQTSRESPWDSQGVRGAAGGFLEARAGVRAPAGGCLEHYMHSNRSELKSCKRSG